MNLNEALEIVNEIDFASEIFEQSKKLIHRIGQEQPCFYYQLTSGIEQEYMIFLLCVKTILKDCLKKRVNKYDNV